jgi:hypothetical protein
LTAAQRRSGKKLVALDHVIPELDDKGLRKFAFTTGGIVAVLFGLIFPLLLERPWPIWPWVIAGALVLPAVTMPRVLKPIYYGWMRFGLLASRITTPLVLGAVFFVIIVPIGLVRGLAGHNSMRRPFEKDQATYRVRREPSSRHNMENPF